MYVHPELQGALTALRQAEIRREVRGEHGIRQEWHERATVAGPRGLARWLEITLVVLLRLRGCSRPASPFVAAPVVPEYGDYGE